MQTYNVKSKDLVRKWYLIDAKEKVLGRLASRIASIVRGKEKATFVPGLNNGDNVVVINADKIKVTGNKMKEKIYRHHSNYPGGLKEIRMDVMMKKHPDYALKRAVWGMLPHNSLGRKMMKNVRIYAGDKHDMSIKDLSEIKV
jgi:large subunit ribosomal protein L13